MSELSWQGRVARWRVTAEPGWASPSVFAALAAGVAVSGLAVAHDEAAADAWRAVPWTATSAVATLLALSSLHFLCGAVGVRSVLGPGLPVRATVFAQVAAAASNRVVPNGLGGIGLNLRYLRRAGVPTGAAVSGLTALSVVAGLTDAGYAGAMTALGPPVGLAGAGHELSRLAASGVRAGQRQWLVLVGAAVVVAALLLWRHRGRTGPGLLTATRDAAAQAGVLARHPGRLVAAVGASTVQTVLLSVGFALAVRVWGVAAHPLPIGALLALYLVATAVGGTTPLPAFFCLTEVTLIGGLVLGGYSSGSAVLAVVLFRSISYWLPLPVGVWMGHRLRAVGLL